MIPDSDISVTLEPELFDRLCAEARRLGVSLEWIVASLVADTFTFEDSLELAGA